MEKTQNRIKNLVEAYKIAFPEEYENALVGIETNRRLQEDEFASAQKSGSVQVGRALYEIPQTLSAMILRELEVDELEFLRSINGARWFAKTFPQFAIAEKI